MYYPDTWAMKEEYDGEDEDAAMSGKVMATTPKSQPMLRPRSPDGPPPGHRSSASGHAPEDRRRPTRSRSRHRSKSRGKHRASGGDRGKTSTAVELRRTGQVDNNAERTIPVRVGELQQVGRA